LTQSPSQKGKEGCEFAFPTEAGILAVGELHAMRMTRHWDLKGLEGLANPLATSVGFQWFGFAGARREPIGVAQWLLDM
jgi:hypothetical protein